MQVLRQIDHDFPEERLQPQIGDTFTMQANAARESLIRLLRHTCQCLLRDLKDEHPDAYAQATGDHNPVHLDEAYAAATRFGGRIAHGLLTVGLISACIARTWPGAIYLGQQVRFLKPVRPGDTVTATLEVVAYDTEKQCATLRTDAHNQRGEQVVGGEASVWVAGG